MRRLSRLWNGGGNSSPSLVLLKKVLLSMLVVGALGTVTGRGVQAALNIESTNTGSSAAVGTFTLSVQVNGQSACQSWTAPTTTNHVSNCPGVTGLLFSPAATLRWPGVADTTAVAVQNTGSIDGQSLEAAVTCIDNTTVGGGVSVTPGASSALVGTEGTGSACDVGGLQFFIQETTTLNGTNSTNGCLYPDTSSPYVPGQGAATDCTTVWTADSLRTLVHRTCWDLGRLNNQQTRYFKIGLRYPPNASNTLQGTQALIGVKWHAVSNDTTGYTPSCANDS